MTWEMPKGFGDWLLGELIDGAQLAIAGEGDGRATAAVHKARELLPPEVREALRVGAICALVELSRADKGLTMAQVGASLLQEGLCGAVRGMFEKEIPGGRRV